MKGILLAGGSGTRLYPITKTVSKQLLPVYDKPLVYYPLTTLIMAGISEILLISSPDSMPQYQHLLGSGERFGVKIKYKIQQKPEGIAQALILAEEFLNGSPSCLILGDNILYGHDMADLLGAGKRIEKGATIFGYHVHDACAYGVVEFGPGGRALSLEEKPLNPKSNYAVPGLYFYDRRAPEFAKMLRPSQRGELEITDLNRVYLEEGSLRVVRLRRGWVWLDAGTPGGLLDAAQFVRTVEERQGLKIGCPEEASYRMGFLSLKDLTAGALQYKSSDYGRYLAKFAADEIAENDDVKLVAHAFPRGPELVR